MIDAPTLLLGPMAGPECLRASRRPWVIWVRMAPAVASGLVAFVMFWVWWMFAQFDERHQPYTEFRLGVKIIEGMLCVFSMILAPAVLAGTLAGEKERGSMGLLLTTRVSSMDLILGRLSSRLLQVLMIDLAAVPALLLMSAMAGLGWSTTFNLLALPLALAFGNGGLAIGASAMSKRGRDALLLVYLINVLFLLGTMLGGLGRGWAWAGWLNPFEPMMILADTEDVSPAQTTSMAWIVVGVACIALAAWRLRPSCLSEGSEARSRKKAKRIGWVPVMDERPMLWKELYIERVGTLGRAGKWIGGLLILWMGLGSVILGGIATADYVRGTISGWGTWAITALGTWYGGSAMFIGFLIQWAIGLRAAVAISSERERGTWDALLTSPLDGGEIVRGKLWGSLYALRWLAASALIAWTITAFYGGLLPYEYALLLVEMLTVGSYMAAIGVRTSLRSATATKSMSATIGLWLAGYLVAKVIAGIVCIVVIVAIVFAWLFAIQVGWTVWGTPPWFPMPFSMGVDLVFYSTMVLATVLIVLETRARFDRVAGRMTGGATAVALDRMLYGVPMAPVLLDGYRKKHVEPAPVLDEAIQTV